MTLQPVIAVHSGYRKKASGLITENKETIIVSSFIIMMYMTVYVCFTIHVMHSFEVNIRICQPENTDVH